MSIFLRLGREQEEKQLILLGLLENKNAIIGYCCLYSEIQWIAVIFGYILHPWCWPPVWCGCFLLPSLQLPMNTCDLHKETIIGRLLSVAGARAVPSRATRPQVTTLHRCASLAGSRSMFTSAE